MSGNLISMLNNANRHEMLFSMEANNNEYNIYLYDKIAPTTINPWTGEVIESSTDANKIREKIDEIPDDSQINLYVSSNGGDVKTGLAIYSQLLRKKANKTAYVDGWACSIASVIIMACDKIVMYPTSLLMIHNAAGACYGNATEHRKFADELDVISSSAVTAYLEKAGDKLTKEHLQELLDAESYLNAQTCLELGLCDEIVTNAAPKADIKTMLSADAAEMLLKALGVQADAEPKKSGADENPHVEQHSDKLSIEMLVKSFMKNFN